MDGTTTPSDEPRAGRYPRPGTTTVRRRCRPFPDRNDPRRRQTAAVPATAAGSPTPLPHPAPPCAVVGAKEPPPCRLGHFVEARARTVPRRPPVPRIL